MRKASRNSELGASTFSFEGHTRDIYGVGGCGVGIIQQQSRPQITGPEWVSMLG